MSNSEVVVFQSHYKLKNGNFAMVWSCPNCYADIYQGFDHGYESAVESGTCPACWKRAGVGTDGDKL